MTGLELTTAFTEIERVMAPRSHFRPEKIHLFFYTFFLSGSIPRKDCNPFLLVARGRNTKGEVSSAQREFLWAPLSDRGGQRVWLFGFSITTHVQPSIMPIHTGPLMVLRLTLTIVVTWHGMSHDTTLVSWTQTKGSNPNDPMECTISISPPTVYIKYLSTLLK